MSSEEEIYEELVFKGLCLCGRVRGNYNQYDLINVKCNNQVTLTL